MHVSDAIVRFAEEPDRELPDPPPPGRRFVQPNFTLALSPMRTHASLTHLRATVGDLDATIAEVREILDTHGYVSCAWYLGPSSRPAGVVPLLLERGFVPATRPPFEARYSVLALTRPPPVHAPAPGVEARLVESYGEYESALAVGFKASGMPDDDIAAWVEAAPALWEHESGIAKQTHVAYVDGQLAGFGFAAPGSLAVLLAGSAVLPAFRGRGAYRALVASRWLAGVKAAKPALVVHAGAMSRPILVRCGFEVICTLHVLMDPAFG
jgi:hypothetical protein